MPLVDANDLSTLHDSEIVSIEINRADKRIVLRFRTETSNVLGLHFSDVQVFRANDVILQNVVSRVLLSSVHEFSKDDLEYWVEWGNSLSNTRMQITEDAKRKTVAQISSGEILLCVVESSWGAEAAIVCKTVAKGQVSS